MSKKIIMPQSGFENYAKAIEALGAEVYFSHPEKCDALLLPGGADINPSCYGQKNVCSAGIDEERDRLEFETFDFFKNIGRPILGICRGAQLINVALGGTLYQDIPGHSRINGIDRLHMSSTIDEALISLYGERFVVNSSHHQAIDWLGSGLRAVQWSEDGTIEAIRHDGLPIFAVQWHPERLHSPIEGRLLIKHWLDTIK